MTDTRESTFDFIPPQTLVFNHLFPLQLFDPIIPSWPSQARLYSIGITNAKSIQRIFVVACYRCIFCLRYSPLVCISDFASLDFLFFIPQLHTGHTEPKQQLNILIDTVWSFIRVSADQVDQNEPAIKTRSLHIISVVFG